MRVLISALLAFQAAQLVSSLRITWVVENFDYHAEYLFTNPAHQNSHGYIKFNLWNTAVADTATCSASSGQLTDFFYGTQWYPCTLPSTAPAGSAVSFRFNRPTGELEINGTIVCSENQGASAAFHIEGTTKLTLACADTTATNPNWTAGTGEFYSTREVKCFPGSCVA
ncbi:hypothetical protein NKR19_g1019 [Coniochaeta hoffmannii]|uniref:AA1-like domain-containing protein n=1 Tax=Coniochaeta hoffmannii TaxID=91930 RepID=A0AA38SD99_9PEZI|nr:hypothetical protein NKR19_g1019 [Coniochaeta hoffmannii]